MKTLFIPAWALIAGALLAPINVVADAPASDSSSAQKFVQGFYTWYLLEEKKDHDTDLSNVATQLKPQWFSPAILQGLQEDEAAAAKSPDEIVGLDFDPFLNSQDICEPYKTGKVTVVDNSYRVEVFGSCPNPGSKQPDVIAAVEKKNGSWVFVDFYYPGYGDLFSVLKNLKEEREKTGN